MQFLFALYTYSFLFRIIDCGALYNIVRSEVSGDEPNTMIMRVAVSGGYYPLLVLQAHLIHPLGGGTPPAGHGHGRPPRTRLRHYFTRVCMHNDIIIAIRAAQAHTIYPGGGGPP